jgi:hypothetical protein
MLMSLADVVPGTVAPGDFGECVNGCAVCAEHTASEDVVSRSTRVLPTAEPVPLVTSPVKFSLCFAPSSHLILLFVVVSCLSEWQGMESNHRGLSSAGHQSRHCHKLSCLDLQGFSYKISLICPLVNPQMSHRLVLKKRNYCTKLRSL